MSDPGPLNTWVTHDLSTFVTDSTLFEVVNSSATWDGTALTPTALIGAEWRFLLPSVYLPTDGTSLIVEVTTDQATVDAVTGYGVVQLWTIASTDPAVESVVTDDYHTLSDNDHDPETTTASSVSTYLVGPFANPPDYQVAFDTDVMVKGYRNVMFTVGNYTSILKIRTMHVESHAPSILRAEGTFDPMLYGSVTFEDRSAVLTVSAAYLTAGWPAWAYRHDHPLDVQFEGTLGDISGSANIYSGDPVAFLVPSGSFDLGSQGSISLLTRYLGVFDDFAAFTALGDDPTLNGWVDPYAPYNVLAPAGDMTTAWTEASTMVYPPKNARFAVPQVTVTSLPAGKSVYLDAFDIRVVPFTESPTVLPTYQAPRNLTVKVRPTRLNLATGTSTVPDLVKGQTYTASADVNGERQHYSFVADAETVTVFPSPNLASNPYFEESTTSVLGWITNAGGSITHNTATPLHGTQSYDISSTAENWGYYPMDGVNHPGTAPTSNPLRVVGQTYTAQIEVRSSTNQTLSLMDYGTSNTHGPAVDVTAGVPTVLTVTFVAGTNVYLSVRDPGRVRIIDPITVDNFQIEKGNVATEFVYSLTNILVEAGTSLGDFFNGDSGPDYLWEQGGTPGATRSYYYQDREARNYILTRLLQENAPLGMQVAQPQYAVYSPNN